MSIGKKEKLKLKLIFMLAGVMLMLALMLQFMYKSNSSQAPAKSPYETWLKLPEGAETEDTVESTTIMPESGVINYGNNE